MGIDDIMGSIGLRVLLKEEVRCIRGIRAGRKGDNTTCPGRVHGTGEGEGRASVVVVGGGRQDGGVVAV